MSQWFYIHSKLNGLVLDVWKEYTSAGSQVRVFKKHGGPNQMFRYDASTKTIQCKMNLYCLDAISKWLPLKNIIDKIALVTFILFVHVHKG